MDRIHAELLAPFLLEERYRDAARQRLANKVERRQGGGLTVAARTGHLLIVAGRWLESIGDRPSRPASTPEPSLSPGGTPGR